MNSSCDEGVAMQRRALLLLWLSLSLALGACSKSSADTVGNSGTPTQLNWDQGSWNQTNWQ